MEYAYGSGHFNHAGHYRGSGSFRALLYLAERVFHLDRAHTQTMMYLKLSVAGHPYDFPHPYTRAILVHKAGKSIMVGSARYANRCNINSGIWFVYDTAWLGLGRFRMGLCFGVVLYQWPDKTALHTGYLTAQRPNQILFYKIVLLREKTPKAVMLVYNQNTKQLKINI